MWIYYLLKRKNQISYDYRFVNDVLKKDGSFFHNLITTADIRFGINLIKFYRPRLKEKFKKDYPKICKLLRNLFQIQEFRSIIEEIDRFEPRVNGSYKNNNEKEFWDLLFNYVDDKSDEDADNHENDQLNLICMMRMF